MTAHSPTETAQQYAHQFLFNAIISGRYPGGTHLKTEDLAEELKTSRMPIREALRQLTAEGLVVIEPHRGAFVTSLSFVDIVELFEMRAALEGLACRIAATLRTPRDEERLLRIIGEMEAHEHSPKAWLTRHDRLHDTICAIANRPRLSKQISLLRDLTRPYVRLYINTHDDPEVSGAEHTALLAALRCSDPRDAEAAMRDHVERNGESIVAFLRTTPGWQDSPT